MKKKVKTSKYFGYLFFFLPIFCFFLLDFNRECDIWFLIPHGEYVLSNGFPHIDFLSMHDGLHFVMQQWLSSVFFYVFYHFFGFLGLYIFIFIITMLILYVLYRICLLLSGKRVFVSAMISSITTLLIEFSTINPRPQIISLLIFLLLFYFLEDFKINNSKKIYFIPLLSFLLIQFHSAVWFCLFIFILPFFTEELYLFIKKKNNKIKELLIIILISFLVGFINPYGIEAITYVFNSYGDYYISNYVNEMRGLNINDNTISIVFHSYMVLIIFFLIILVMLYRKKNISIHQILLLFGTFYMVLNNIRNFSLFIIFSVPFLVKYINIKDSKNKKIPKELYLLLSCIVLCVFISNIYHSYYKLTNPNQKIVYYLNKNATKEIKLYTRHDNGSLFEFYGYKPYIDSRAEVFLKTNNKKENIFREYYLMSNGKINIDKFLSKYNFDYLVIEEYEVLYSYLLKNEEYEMVYKDTEYDKYLFKRKE